MMLRLIPGLVAQSAIGNRIYGVKWSPITETFERLGTLSKYNASDVIPNAMLPIQAKMKGCVLNDNGTVNYFLDPDNHNKKEDGVTDAVLDGTDGMVMVEIPEFYYKMYIADGKYYYWLSEMAVSGFTRSKKMYIGKYAGYINSTKLESRVGVKPSVSQNITTLRSRATARGTGFHLLDHVNWMAVNNLFITEYASMDWQAKISGGNTKFSTFDYAACIANTGKSNLLGMVAGGQSTTGGNSGDFVSYRGIEDWFGNLWQFLDGTAVRNDGTNGSLLYVATNSTNYASYGENNTDTARTGYNLIGSLVQVDCYGKTPLNGTFMPATSGGASNSGLCDYYYTSFDNIPTVGWRVVLVGGAADNGVRAGGFYVNSLNGFALSSSSVGGRLCFRG